MQDTAERISALLGGGIVGAIAIVFVCVLSVMWVLFPIIVYFKLSTIAYNTACTHHEIRKLLGAAQQIQENTAAGLQQGTQTEQQA